MAGNIVFLKRTSKEAQIFGGEVFIDIDGKNIGKLSENNLELTLSEGSHTIKMYKSHTYDTFIGFAESTIEIKDDSHLLVRYSPPMIVTQPGNIIITEYENDYQINLIAEDRISKIEKDFTEDEIKKQKQEETHSRSVAIWTIIILIIAILSFIEIYYIYN